MSPCNDQQTFGCKGFRNINSKTRSLCFLGLVQTCVPSPVPGASAFPRTPFLFDGVSLAVHPVAAPWGGGIQG